MAQITQMLQAFESGDRPAAEKLLPLVYDELRTLAAAYLAKEQHAHTRQATSLVHEAYLRLLKNSDGNAWNNERHFFGAVAIAIRRILVENARQRNSLKRGGGVAPTHLFDDPPAPVGEPIEDLLSLDEALTKLSAADPQAAEFVQLVYFSGLTHQQAAEVLGISTRSATRLWAYAKAWLRHELREQES